MIVSRSIALQTGGNNDVIDITSEVQMEIGASGVADGTVTIFVSGSTAGLTTIEYEPGVVSDFQAMWERIIPQGIKYNHDRAWGDGNGHSHVRASLLGASMVVPFAGGKLMLGTWQQIILVDFDNRARSRKIVLQITGE